MNGTYIMSGISPIEFDDRQFTAREAADYLRISTAFLYRLIGRGAVRPYRLGSRTLFSGAELKRALVALTDEAAQSTAPRRGRPRTTRAR